MPYTLDMATERSLGSEDAGKSMHTTAKEKYAVLTETRAKIEAMHKAKLQRDNEQVELKVSQIPGAYTSESLWSPIWPDKQLKYSTITITIFWILVISIPLFAAVMMFPSMTTPRRTMHECTNESIIQAPFANPNTPQTPLGLIDLVSSLVHSYTTANGLDYTSNTHDRLTHQARKLRFNVLDTTDSCTINLLGCAHNTTSSDICDKAREDTLLALESLSQAVTPVKRELNRMQGHLLDLTISHDLSHKLTLHWHPHLPIFPSLHTWFHKHLADFGYVSSPYKDPQQYESLLEAQRVVVRLDYMLHVTGHELKTTVSSALYAIDSKGFIGVGMIDRVNGTCFGEASWCDAIRAMRASATLWL